MATADYTMKSVTVVDKLRRQTSLNVRGSTVRCRCIFCWSTHPFFTAMWCWFELWWHQSWWRSDWSSLVPRFSKQSL